MATRSARDNKALNARHAETLKAMLRRPENKTCADCKRNDPRWASTNLGCFMCIRCSGIHRSMGVHITRIKSIDLDTWTAEQVANVQRWGNKRANAYWEAHLRPGHMPPDHKIESFIRSKYESKRWAMEGPVPEPETLDDGTGGTEPAPAAATIPTSGAAASRLPSATLSKAPAVPPPMSGISLLDGPPSSSNKLLPRKSTSETKSASPFSAATKAGSSNTGGGGGLFDLDFSPSASSAAAVATAPAARKDVKNDILSLFAAKPQNHGNQNQLVGQNGGMNVLNNQFGGMNLMMSNTPPQPGQGNNHSFAVTQKDAFGNVQDPWATLTTKSQSQDPFGNFASGTNTTSSNANKDVFSDIWN